MGWGGVGYLFTRGRGGPLWLEPGGGFLVCPLGDGMVVEADSDPPYFKEGAGEAGARGEVSEEVSNVGAAR
eukprot:scaffold3445_cov118-Isochrysis_galbana.AAC.1